MLPTPWSHSGASARGPSEGEQIVFFRCLELYHKPPDSGQRQFKSRIEKKSFDAATQIRSNSLIVAGGGNAANTLVALRRLGVPSSLATHLGQVVATSLQGGRDFLKRGSRSPSFRNRDSLTRGLRSP